MTVAPLIPHAVLGEKKKHKIQVSICQSIFTTVDTHTYSLFSPNSLLSRFDQEFPQFLSRRLDFIQILLCTAHWIRFH